jgi:hypothetical protein
VRALRNEHTKPRCPSLEYPNTPGQRVVAGGCPSLPMVRAEPPKRWAHSAWCLVRHSISPSRGNVGSPSFPTTIPQSVHGTREQARRQKANSTIDQQHLPGRVLSLALTRARARPQYPPTSAPDDVPFPPSARPRRDSRPASISKRNGRRRRQEMRRRRRAASPLLASERLQFTA